MIRFTPKIEKAPDEVASTRFNSPLPPHKTPLPPSQTLHAPTRQPHIPGDHRRMGAVFGADPPPKGAPQPLGMSLARSPLRGACPK